MTRRKERMAGQSASTTLPIGSHLARKQLLFILLFSSIITLIGTLVQLSVEYYNDVEDINTQLAQIGTSHIESLTNSLWRLDDEQVKIQLKDMLSLRDIIYLEITEKGENIFSSGTAIPTRQFVLKDYLLVFEHDGAVEQIGTLKAYATLHGVYRRLLNRAFLILSTQGLKTFIVSLFILFTLHRLVIRHLLKISNYARSFRLDDMKPMLALDRKPVTAAKKDELDVLVQAVNNMRERLIDDIAIQKKTEQELKEKEEYLRSIYKAADNVAFVMTDMNNEDTRIIDVSPGAENIFEYTREEMIGQKVGIFHLKEAVEKFSTLQAVLEQGNVVYPRETTMVRKSGKQFPALFTIHPKLDASGKVVGTIGVAIDISQRKALEKKLQQAHKMEAVGRLAGGIAHDFNNILSIIIGNADLALDHKQDPVPVRKYIQEIQKASLRAKDIISQLLNYTRKAEPLRRPVALGRIIEESIDILQSMITQDVRIECWNRSRDDTILADPEQINQVMINLGSNASHAMENSGGVLQIEAINIHLDENSPLLALDLQPGLHIQVMVKDSGHGIDAQDIDRIFDPYFTTKAIGKGSGIGLSVVQGIIKGHGGAIRVESLPGGGSRFIFYLPVAEAKTTEPGKPEPRDDIPTGSERILFVDDEKAMVKLGRLTLEGLGYHVETEVNPKSALERFQTGRGQFDLVITDMAMPDMTGDLLVKEILAICPQIPIILYTGYSDKIDGQNAQTIGAAKYLQKPLNKKELAIAVRQVLDSQPRQT